MENQQSHLTEKLREKIEQLELERKKLHGPLNRATITTLRTNIMICGIAGASKTSLVAALQKSLIRANRKNGYEVEEQIELKRKNILPTKNKLEFHTLPKLYLKDDDINLTYETNVIDTAGFGDSIDGFISTILPAIGYIWNNIHNKDKRVHYAIYVLSPNRYLDTDKYYIAQLCKYTNVIVTAGKSDSYTLNEFIEFQQTECEGLCSLDIWKPKFSSDGSHKFPRCPPFPIVTNERIYPWTDTIVSETTQEISCLDELWTKAIRMESGEREKLKKIAARLSISGMFSREYWRIESEFLFHYYHRNIFSLAFLVIIVIFVVFVISTYP